MTAQQSELVLAHNNVHWRSRTHTHTHSPTCALTCAARVIVALTHAPPRALAAVCHTLALAQTPQRRIAEWRG
jgi:phage terminase large subunit-like protein